MKRSEEEVSPYATVAGAVASLPRRLFLLPLILGGFAGLFFQFFGSWTTRSSFTPQQQSASLSSLSGIASQLGITGLPASLGATQSAPFYEQLLLSSQLLVKLAERRYEVISRNGDLVEGTLFDFYGIDGRTVAERNEKMVKRLRNRITVSVHQRSSIVSVVVKAPFPELSAQVNRQLLDLVSEFNQTTLQSVAAEERRFVGQRLDAAKSELDTSETLMQRFLERNRMYQSSPELVFQAARLQRQVELRQQVFVGLSQAFEQAKISEVRNTPVLTVIDPPEVTLKRSRSPIVMGAAATAFGVFLLGLWALARSSVLAALGAVGRLWSRQS